MSLQIRQGELLTLVMGSPWRICLWVVSAKVCKRYSSSFLQQVALPLAPCWRNEREGVDTLFLEVG